MSPSHPSGAFGQFARIAVGHVKVKIPPVLPGDYRLARQFSTVIASYRGPLGGGTVAINPFVLVHAS